MTFERVTMHFGQTVALREFNLQISKGELVSLLGPSGCGKTTALRLAAGFITPTSGNISVAGVDITRVPAHKRNMGMVFQSYSLFPNLSVRENIEFGLRTRKIPTKERRQVCEDMIGLVLLQGLEDRFPHQLSGGQQQRVALARALAIRPEVLLLDEPLSALDAKVRLELRDQIRRVQKSLGITTVFVTHDQEEALAISDRVAVMSNGIVEQIDSPYLVYKRPKTENVARFIGSIVEIPALVVEPNALQVGGRRLTCGEVSAPVGSMVRLMVRPEEFRINTDIDSRDCLLGTVLRTEFRGSQTLLYLAISDVAGEVLALAPMGASPLAAGSHVAVRLSQDFGRVVRI